MVKRQDTSKRLLKDHKKIGKKFIPPFLSQIRDLKETPWLTTVFPEILWLGMMNESLGIRSGADLAAETARAVRDCVSPSNQLLFCRLSDFVALNEEERTSFREKLGSSGILWALCTALHPLYANYPTFPLRFLYSDAIREQLNGISDLHEFKDVVLKLRDKYGVPGTLMQASAIYIAFATERLVVRKGLTLASFPAIADYPNTVESKEVASAIRPTLMSLFAFDSTSAPSTWKRDFWLRGLELGECEF